METEEIKEIITTACRKNWRIVTAESLTCGRISATLANIPGASGALNGGFCVYQDEMKTALLGVPAGMLREFTAVSAPVAGAMAEGALLKTGSDILGAKASSIAVAVTGYAGSPGGLAPESDAGLVYISIATRFNDEDIQANVLEHRFPGSREEVRQAVVDRALQYIRELVCV